MKGNRHTVRRFYMKKVETIPPQVKAILNFQQELMQKTGRIISFSEAIAGWIALGYAEQYRTDQIMNDV